MSTEDMGHLGCSSTGIIEKNITKIKVQLMVPEFLTNSKMVLVPYPPYSLDLAPSVFWFCFVSTDEEKSEMKAIQ
ncbi:hypothetical protein TNCV_2408771 [Trichonephila clavipes]|nr:hypothetical protein TNCV_2408771 [Trichonephila clavipes]